MRRVAALLAGALIAVFIAAAWWGGAAAAPARDELLRMESELVYTILPGEGPVRVSWHVDLQNNDPATTFQPFGTVYFYESFALPLLRGASSVAASGPGGVPLAVSVDESGATPIVAATVSLGHALYYGDRYAFTLTYELRDTRSDALLITPAYVYLPAIAAGDVSTVTVRTPDGTAWDVTLEAIECAPAEEASFTCSGSEALQVAALVEVTRPDALRSIDTTLDLDGGEVSLQISYFPAEEAWAAHIRELAEAALPVLEEIYGVTYERPRHVTIAERGRQQIAGYEGTFRCSPNVCDIGLSPVADDLVAVHEFAHLWTEIFDSRWLAEGLAEFASRRAAERLGDLVSPRVEAAGPSADLYLDEWGPAAYLIAADEERLERELAGYAQSLRMFETLEDEIGLEAIQAANAAAFALDEQIDSRTYFDLLEEASGERLDDLFLEEVFPPSFAPVLEQRRGVRDRFVQLAVDAEAAGLRPLLRVEWLVGDWRFDDADEMLSDAAGALAAYVAASARLEDGRSVWMRLGLIGRDPDGALQDAADAFARGDYDDAAEYAGHAEDLIDGAGRAALVRLLIGVGALALIGGAATAVVWVLRRRRSAA